MPDKQDTAKQAAARHAVTFVQDGMIVGLGTGSTAFYALEALAQRVREGLKIQGVPTSLRTEALARGFGIPLLKDYPSFDRVDLTIDGADEVDPSFCAIKGGGGALTREKIIAAASERMVVMVDESKVVAKLGKFPLAVEVLQMGWRVAVRRLEDLGCQAALRRQDDGQPFLTDNGHYIVDCKFGEISAPQELEREINCIPGVVENGLFVGLVDAVVVGFPDGRVEVRPAEGSGR
jgi:ribose 5-phosphate isomerase A